MAGENSKRPVERLQDAHDRGVPLERVFLPWADYDRAAEDGTFFPMCPINGGKERFNVQRIETDLRRAILRLADPATAGRSRWLAEVAIRRYRSWLAQLRDEPGAIPDEAGDGYRRWAGELREQ